MSEQQATPVSSANATAAAGAATAKSKTGPAPGESPGYTTSTVIHSVGQLKEEAPDVWKAMCMGIAMTICRRMKKHQNEMSKMIRESFRRD